MKKKLISAILAVAMVILLLPNLAFAAAEDYYLRVNYNNYMFIMTIDGSGTETSITSTPPTGLSGDRFNHTLTLNGLNFESSLAYGFQVWSNYDVAFTLLGTNNITSVGTAFEDGCSNLTITGTGTLNAKGTGSNGIGLLINSARCLTIDGGTIFVTGATAAIKLASDNAQISINSAATVVGSATYNDTDANLTAVALSTDSSDAGLVFRMGADGKGEIAKTVKITVPAQTAPSITTTSLSGGTVGVSYSQTLASSGTTPITWSIASGSLPQGLSLNATTGVISGTPTSAGTSNFTIKATNAVSSDTKALSITIAQGISSVTLSSNSPTLGEALTATIAPKGATATYQWYTNTTASTAGGSAISGATSSSYTPVVADLGKYIYVVATGSGNYTSSASAVTTGTTMLNVTAPANFAVGEAPASTMMVIGSGVTGMDSTNAPVISVTVDGQAITLNSDYTVSYHSIDISFSQSFLNSLSAGKHTAVVTIGGTTYARSYTTTFNVNAHNGTAPRTGDNGNVTLWISLLLASEFMLSGLIIATKRKQKSQK